MALHIGWRETILGAALFAASMAIMAMPPPAHQQGGHAAILHAKLQNVDAEITAARSRNADLQAQVTQMEQQNAAQQKQLQQRDAEIASLQQKLHAGGIPVASASAGH